MSIVNLVNVQVLNNPAKFTDPYSLEITFECLEALKEDLEWKLVYVGSARSTQHDQELDSLLVGPVPVGVNKFVFNADPPSIEKIPHEDILGPTVMLLTCAYDEREFVRVGYYVNNEYDEPELRERAPVFSESVQIEHVMRNILADKPRITRFNIKWDNPDSAPSEFPPPQPGVDNEPDEVYGENEEDDEDDVGDEEISAEEEKPGPKEDLQSSSNGELKSNIEDKESISII